MKLCENCGTYEVMPIVDKDQPSSFAPIAQQSDADQHERFIFAYPTTPGSLCYYCGKKAAKRIDALHCYDNSYDQKDR